MPDNHHFEQVTLLITHYNRSKSLERLLAAFNDLQCTFSDIVVSDDGSRPEHLQYIEQLKDRFSFRLITTPKNKGLGNNINKGQDAVTTPYTLYVQEDFVPKDTFPLHFQNAFDFMEQDKGLDIVRFYAYFPYPYMKPYGKGYSEMVFHKMPWYTNHLKFYFYSDHPHLRRSNFFEKFGRYTEGVKGDLTEYWMSLGFIHYKARGLFFNDYTQLFDQRNSPDEPSTMERSDWRQSKNPLVQMMRSAYLVTKFSRWSWDVFAGKHLTKKSQL